MCGDEGEARQVVPAGSAEIEPQRICRPPMEQAAPREAGHLVRGVAQAAVAEVVADRARRRRADLAHDPAPHELLDGIHGLLLGSTARVAQRPEIEGPPDHGRRRQDLGSRLADRRDALAQQLLDAARHVAAHRLVAGEHLDDVERQALGVGGDGIDERVVGRAGRS